MESVGLSSSSADDGAPSVSVLLALSLVRPSASSVSDMRTFPLSPVELYLGMNGV